MAGLALQGAVVSVKAALTDLRTARGTLPPRKTSGRNRITLEL
jgi:hypothetical protein